MYSSQPHVSPLLSKFHRGETIYLGTTQCLSQSMYTMHYWGLTVMMNEMPPVKHPAQTEPRTQGHLAIYSPKNKEPGEGGGKTLFTQCCNGAREGFPSFLCKQNW